MRGKVIAIVFAILVVTALVWAGGTATEQTFYSEALGANRTLLVYLPDGYATSGLHYPVIYFMHGADGGVGSWYLTDFLPILDEMIAGGLIDPMIIVEPDSGSSPPPLQWQQRGFHEPIYHFHSNSVLLGKNEDYLAEDVVGMDRLELQDLRRSRTPAPHRPLHGRSRRDPSGYASSRCFRRRQHRCRIHGCGSRDIFRQSTSPSRTGYAGPPFRVRTDLQLLLGGGIFVLRSLHTEYE